MSAAPRVLVVDDEPTLVKVLVRFLERDGVTAVGAANGVEALARLGEAPFDLVLCDVRMPVLDGPATLREMRRRGIDAPPVVFLTGYADSSDASLVALGACAVYGKPVEAATVREIVRVWAKAPGGVTTHRDPERRG